MKKMTVSEMMESNGGYLVYECKCCTYWLHPSIFQKGQKALGRLFCPRCKDTNHPSNEWNSFNI